ncbi:MAG: L,D-transpeptidase family protein [Phycisphaerales bacterium]
MTLPSQTARVESRVSISPKRTPFGAPSALAGVVIVGIVALSLAAGLFIWSRLSGGEANMPAHDLAAKAAGPAADAPVNAAADTSAMRAASGPVVIDMIPTATPDAPAGAPTTAAGSTVAATTTPASAPATGPGAGETTAPGAGVPTGVAQSAVESAQRALAAGKPVEAREVLNRALFDASTSAADRAAMRAQIAALNEQLFFGPVVAAGDPLSDWYTVRAGDSLVRIVRSQSLPTDWRLLQRLNRMSSPNALRVGQRLKVIRQPLHAVVHKKDYRLDLWAGSPLPMGSSAITNPGPDGQASGWTFIRSFRVGLGESNGTPTGLFIVRPNSKLVDPRWVNPRTGQVYAASDPQNPIGEFWIGLDGVDASTRQLAGYGIHGTIEPDSIGQQRSMGCVRLGSEDIALLYELLIDRISTVRIVD